MSATPLLVGVDCGTTTIKAIAFTPNGRVVAAAGVPTPTQYPRPGWAYYAPDELWSCTVDALHQLTAALDDPARIAGIAVASIGETGVPLDRGGRPLAEAIAWFDNRTEAQARRLNATIGGARFFAATGLPVIPIFSLCKMLWLQEERPDAWQQAATWLNAADYLAYRLSGEMATDYSMASRTLALNLARLEWDRDLVREAGISPDVLAPLAQSGTRLGPILPEVAAATGLPAHTVVGVGGHDHVCGAFALGITESGHVLDSMGTAEGIFLPLEQPITDAEALARGYSQGAHVAGGYYGLAGIYTSGICVDWFRETFADNADYATLMAEAQEVQPGSLGVYFLPHLRRTNPGYAMEHSRAVFIGLSSDVSRGVAYRALLEGLAYEARYTLSGLLAHTAHAAPTHISVTGGGTRNRLLLDIKANVFGHELDVVSVDEATALGAALLGGVAAGLYADCRAAAAAVDYDVVRVTPEPAVAAWYARAYTDVYQHLGVTLGPLHAAIHNLDSPP
ncbi:MAG: hypothetical protein KDE20_04890 [Caldilineaceae bacterium]|nr:hypothetical protein [Caldilineaceae bacterium]